MYGKIKSMSRTHLVERVIQLEQDWFAEKTERMELRRKLNEAWDNEHAYRKALWEIVNNTDGVVGQSMPSVIISLAHEIARDTLSQISQPGDIPF